MLRLPQLSSFLKFAVSAILVVFFAFYIFQINPLFLGSSANYVRIRVNGRVEIMRPTASYWSLAVNNSKVEEGSKVRTSSQSTAVLIYPSGSQTRLDKNTQITLSKFTQNPQNILVDISNGRVWSSIVKLLGKEQYQTAGPQAVATVRGTSYIHAVLASGVDQIIVTESAVELGCKKMESKRAVTQGSMLTSNCQKDLPNPSRTPKEILEDDWIDQNIEEDKVQKETIQKNKNNVNLFKLDDEEQEENELSDERLEEELENDLDEEEIKEVEDESKINPNNNKPFANPDNLRLDL